MTIGENLTEFGGLPVRDFDSTKGIEDPAGISYRVRLDWDDYDKGVKFAEVLAKFLGDPKLGEVKSFVIGAWAPESDSNSESIIRAIVEAQDKLQGLEHLFFGDITFEEQEISWILQSDISPLFGALPNLRTLRVRGADGLKLTPLPHAHLREFALESGGLPSDVIRAALACEFPELEHLELWLGDDGYGWDGNVKLFDDLLAGKLFPKLKYLGLRDSMIADDIAEAIAAAPILERIEVLDLSMGTLGDKGVEALTQSPQIGKLKKLDIHHHYASTEKTQALAAAVNELDAGDPEEPDVDDGEEYRYVAVAE